MSLDNEKVENIEVAENAEVVEPQESPTNMEKAIEKEIVEQAKSGDEEAMILNDIIAAQNELNDLKEKYGLQEEEKGLKKAISNFFDKRDALAEVPFNKKKYVWLAVLLGWMGGHRFYTKQYTTAVLYLLTCWTGYSLAMTIIDLMIVLPKKADENGNIYLF